MKFFGIKIAAISLLLLSGLVGAFANGKNLKGSISLSQPVQVNDVKLKPRTYDVKFNAETNEVSISNENGVVTTAKVSVRNGDEKPDRTQVILANTDKGYVLSKLVFKGDTRVIVLNEAAVVGN